MPPLHELKPGDRVAGRYEILRRLGAGEPGDVYLAVQQPLGREVVVKVLERGEQPHVDARFQKEGAALALLAHPACAEVIDYGAWEARLFLVLRYVQGVELQRELQGTPWPAGEALTLAIDVAEGLAHAHERGVVHRNLGPARVILSQERGDRRSAVVVDWGMAQVDTTEPDTTVGRKPVGTPGYLAPERIRGARGDERTDVYAVGVMLYEMLAGRHPFRKTSDALEAHLAARVPRLDALGRRVRCTRAVADVVDIAMRPDPADRFRDGHELAVALRAARVTLADPELADETFAMDAGLTTLPPSLSARIHDPTPTLAPPRTVTPDDEEPPVDRTVGCVVAALVAGALLVVVGVVITGTVVGTMIVGSLAP